MMIINQPMMSEMKLSGPGLIPTSDIRKTLKDIAAGSESPQSQQPLDTSRPGNIFNI